MEDGVRLQARLGSGAEDTERRGAGAGERSGRHGAGGGGAELGDPGAVLQHGQRLTERDPGLEVAVVANEVPPLPAAVEVAAYRIASEALNNVSRHAGARNCRVGIALDAGGSLVVEIEDDGVGLPAQASAGVGLTAMRERAVELGGTCEAVRGALGGTRVEARIPVGSR